MTRRRTLAAAAALLPLAVGGCHRNPPVVLLPPPPPPVMVSVPPPGHPFEPALTMDLEEAEALTIVLPRRPVGRFRPSAVPRIVLAPLPPPPIPLGQLTTGDVTPRQETEDLMHAQERRLIDISPAIAALHAQQIEEARLFLRQAEEAWEKLDVDGAHTLATKAKVLLDEVLA